MAVRVTLIARVTAKTIGKAHASLAARDGGNDRYAFIADPHVQTTAGGRSIVHLQQEYGGIPLFAQGIAVHLRRGKVVEIAGEVVRETPAGDGTPEVSATDAVIAAHAHFRPKNDRSACRARHGSLRGAAPVPSIVASFPFPSRPTVFSARRGASAPAVYLAYWNDTARPRLVWVVRAPFRAEAYLLLVSAAGGDAGQVILCTRWSSGARCFGTVFSFDHAAGRTRTPFPMPLAQFPPLLPHPNAAFLGDWVDLDGTAGNNALTFDGNTELLVKAAMSGGSLEFPLLPPSSRQQTLLNAFFYCNFLHDFFLMLGFGEVEGNFQLKNFSAQAGGNDRLRVRIFDKKNPNLADMDARDDGMPAKLTLGRAPSGEPTGLHAELVIHEYTHGVVHRMVGGRLATAWLVQQQSQAMDEGWADYFAITLRNHFLGATPNYHFADWSGVKARTASYDPSVLRDFGTLGKKPAHTINSAGEIFAAALIRFNELLGARLADAARGHCIGWRAVIESLRLITPNPHFLHGRDALLGGIDELRRGGAITAAEATDARDAARAAFARYGMGRNAKSANAAFGGTTSDFTP